MVVVEEKPGGSFRKGRAAGVRPADTQPRGGLANLAPPVAASQGLRELLHGEEPTLERSFEAKAGVEHKGQSGGPGCTPDRSSSGQGYSRSEAVRATRAASDLRLAPSRQQQLYPPGVPPPLGLTPHAAPTVHRPSAKLQADASRILPGTPPQNLKETSTAAAALTPSGR
jgi:hypothetical protein